MSKYLRALFISCSIISIFACSSCHLDTKENSQLIGSNNDITDTKGTETYKDFILDNIYHSKTNGDIHYNIYIPSSYDGQKAFALFMTLPGYEGLYFQGVGANIRAEDYGFEAQKYISEMIIVAPQLNDWRLTSANQTIDLTEHIIDIYNIDENRVYANGLSGGGETMSLVMGIKPDLFTAYLHCSSSWDGNLEVLVSSKTPLYLVIGENDEYYGSTSLKNIYSNLYALYEKSGLTDKEIDEILVLDVKTAEYFNKYGFQNQHAGGLLFAFDEEIMGWLFKW